MILEVSASSPLMSRIIQHVSLSAACVKSEQIDDPQMDFTERVRIIEEILVTNPGRFLERFGAQINDEHLCYFENLNSEDYSLNFHITQVKRRLLDTKNLEVKNRRFAALKKLVKDGVYFNDSEMKSRNPLLYEQLVGQHMTEDEQIERDRANFQNMTLATFLMARFDKEYEAKLCKAQIENEEAVMEECDDDSEEEEEMQENPIIEDEKMLLRQEFVTQMYNSFLHGLDKDFDYSTVDTNTDYDDIQAKERDDEDSYFDSETPEVVQRSSSIDAVSANSTEEDELDAFMKTLPPTENQVDS